MQRLGDAGGVVRGQGWELPERHDRHVRAVCRPLLGARGLACGVGQLERAAVMGADAYCGLETGLPGGLHDLLARARRVKRRPGA